MSRIRKAVTAFIGAFVTGLATAAAQKGSVAFGWPEVGAAVGLGLAAAWAVWRVPNAGTTSSAHSR